MGTSAAARRLHLARQLTELPDTEAAWRSGAIGTGHAAVIGRTVDEMGDAGAHAAEPTLLDAAERMNPGHVWLIGQRLRHSLDRERALADARLRLVRRREIVFKEGETSLITLFAATRAEDIPPAYETWVEPPLTIRRRDGGVPPESSAILMSFGFPPGNAVAP